MANTQVVIRDEMGLRIPSVPGAPITAADTITFAVEEGADSALYFAPETAEILSPTPSARVDLPFGLMLTYTFAAPGQGTYGVVTQAPEDSAPESFQFGTPASPPVLVIQPGQGGSYPILSNPPQG